MNIYYFLNPKKEALGKTYLRYNQRYYTSALTEADGSVLDFKEKIDLILTLGGDGTVLQAVKQLSAFGIDSKIPLYCVNFGTVGFICPFSSDRSLEIRNTEIKQMDSLLYNNDFSALNEIVISKNYGQTIETFTLFLNGRFLYSYRGDGLIISTGIGSTAYNFSAGGPIITSRDSGIICLTPVCCIDSSVKPVVLNITEADKLVVETKNKSFPICDGEPLRHIYNLNSHSITLSDSKVSFYYPKDFNYFDLLKDKLGWARLQP